MKEEYLDILDENGEKTGQKETILDTHRKALIHRTVHVWLVNDEGQILVQKRSKTMRAYPGYWYNSASGHISAGESSLEAAQKETKEEIGVEFPEKDFVFLFTVRMPKVELTEEFTDNEFNDVYLVRCNFPLEKFKIQEREVEDLKWISINEFKSWVRGDGPLLIPNQEEYNLLLKELEK